jgi:hypothetical protein
MAPAEGEFVENCGAQECGANEEMVSSRFMGCWLLPVQKLTIRYYEKGTVHLG